MRLKFIAHLFLFLRCFDSYFTIFDSYESFSIKVRKEDSTSINLEEICECDLNENYCDLFCCCDKSCEFESNSNLPFSESFTNNFGISYWESNNKCLNTQLSIFEYYMAQCRNYEKIASLEDMFNPIRVFYQNFRGGLCVAFDNSQNATKVEKESFTVKNTQEFSDLIRQYKKVDDLNIISYLYNSTSFQVNIPSIYDSKMEVNLKLEIEKFSQYQYQPMNPLIIKSNKLPDKYFSLKFPVVSPYGSCKNNLDTIKFLQNKKITCSYKINFNQNDCHNYNLKNILYDSSPLLIFNKTSQKIEYLEPMIKGYKIERKLYYKEIVLNEMISPSYTFDSSKSEHKCLNVVTRVNNEFLMKNEAIINYKISFYFEDIENKNYNTEHIPVTYDVIFKSADEVMNYIDIYTYYDNILFL